MTGLPRLGITLAVLLLASGCAGQGQPARGSSPPVSVDRILDDPDDFFGQRVRLSARVADPIDTRSFTLKDQDPLIRERLLVVTRRPLGQLLGEEETSLKRDDELLVTGVVREGNIVAIEAELGVDLDAKVEQRFRGKPVLIASEVVRTEGKPTAEPDTVRQGY